MAEAGPSPDRANDLDDLLIGDDEAAICAPIPQAACDERPGNFPGHVAALALTRLGEGLADPRLVLAWLASSLGAPLLLIGLLVPLRQALPLLPQLLAAGRIRGRPIRKWLWCAGTLAEGVALILMAIATLFLDGMAAGIAIILCLAALSLGRGVAVAAHADVLAKTLRKDRHDAVRRIATALGGFGTAAFGIYLVLFERDQNPEFFGLLLAIAGILLIQAAVSFARFAEAPGASEGGGDALAVVRASLPTLGQEPVLRRFVIARALLIGTALVPPFLAVLLQQQPGAGLADLGRLVVAACIAMALGATAWSGLERRSGRLVMLAAGALASLSALVAGLATIQAPQGQAMPLLVPAIVFLVTLAHAGLRIGERHYPAGVLVDTLTGLAILVSGALAGLVATWAGIGATLLLLGLLTGAGVLVANGLPEEKRRGK